MPTLKVKGPKILECGSTFYVGLMGMFRMLLQKSMRMDMPLLIIFKFIYMYKAILDGTDLRVACSLHSPSK